MGWGGLMAECGREMEFEHRLTDVEARAKSNGKRLDEVEKRQEALDKMATSMAVLAEKQSSMAEKVDVIDGKVTAIEKKPADRAEKIWSKIVELLLAAIIGFILSRIGLE